jgi:hypothetical protein
MSIDGYGSERDRALLVHLGSGSLLVFLERGSGQEKELN